MTLYLPTDGTLGEPLPLTGDDVVAATGQPHLVIGMGRIGQRTITELRRTLDRSCRSRTAHTLPIDYLLIDMENAAQPLADVPSTPIRGDGKADFCLSMERARDFSRQLPDEAGHELSRYEVATEIGSDTTADLRGLGGLLLAAEADRLQKWLNQRAGELLRLDDTLKLQVHVVGYLAGGLGGGALTRLLVELRHNRLMAGRCRILFYGLSPDGDQASTDGCKAADVDEGAVSITRADAPQYSAPEPVEVDEKGFHELCDEILLISPPADSGQLACDVRALPEALAMTLWQRLFMPAGALLAENRTRRVSMVAAAPLVLSTAGDEVVEALSVGLLQTALYQLIYARWRPGRGFVDEIRPFDPVDHIARAETQSAWLLSAEHLIQSAPILEADAVDQRWSPLAEEWRDGAASLFEQPEGRERKDWLDILTSRWEQYFREKFRDVGVAAFYSGRLALRCDMARAIRGKIEKSLFDDWREGRMGLMCARSILDALIAQQVERLAKADDRVANIRSGEEACRVRTAAVYQKWTRLSSWESRRDREAKALVSDYAFNLHELFINRTRAEGWLFAKALLPAVIEELECLRQQLGRLVGILQQGARSVDMVLEGMSARMGRDEAAAESVQQWFDRRKLGELARDMLVGEAEQQLHCQQARQVLARHATPDGEFHAVVHWVERNDWMAPITALCRGQIVGADGLWTGAVRDIVDASIYEVLQARTDENFGRLRDLAATLTDRAISRLPETVRHGAPSRIHVLLPRDDRQNAFIRTLKSAFSFSHRSDISFVEVEDCCDRISILVVAADVSFPDATFLRHLDRRYRSYVRRDRDYAMRAAQGRGGEGDEQMVSPLGEPAGAELIAALLLIGLPLNLVVERFADDSRLGQLWLIPKHENGFDDRPIAIAGDLLSAPTRMSPVLVGLLKDNVDRALHAVPGDRERLKGAIVDWIVKIRALCRDDPLDEIYRVYVEGGKLAVSLLHGRAGKALANG